MRSQPFVTASFLLLVTACSPSGTAPTEAETAQFLVAGPGAPSGLAYAQGRATYRAGRAIPSNTASVSGANITFSVQPALPNGLTLDPSTGAISGTPVGTSPTTLYAVTATNANGATSVRLSITVLAFSSELETANSGQAGSMRLVRANWGRLVDVYDRDAAGSSRLVAKNLLVNELAGLGSIYLLETNIVTQGTRVTISAPLGSSAFANAYDGLQANLPVLEPAAPDDLLPFSVVPRNAAIALVFDDLIDPASISPETVRVLTGTPSTTTQGVRLLADPNHGNVTDRDGDGRLEFWPTRVLLDPVVTETEALASAHSISPDADGYPASSSSVGTNLLVRIPTLVDPGAGQNAVLTNLSGAAVSSANSAPFDPNVSTEDVVRALRSGGPGDLTGDPYQGFLADFTEPRVVAEIPVVVSNEAPDPLGNPEDRRVSVTYPNADCAGVLRAGQALEIDGSVLEVLETSGAGSGLTYSNVRVKVFARPTSLVGPATLHVRLDLALDQNRLRCFQRFDPPAGAPPAALVDPSARIVLRADEALGVASLSGMDATRITRLASDSPTSVVPARYSVLDDLRGVRVEPLVPLDHANGASETYTTNVGGWRDLAGNLLAEELVGVPFLLDSTAPSVNSGGVTFRFESTDMLPGAGRPADAGSGKPEFRGQFLTDFNAESIRARPVSRFQLAADRTQPVPSLMIPYAPGVSTPISRFGSKLQSIWRYCDVGLGLLDESFHNIDVEHLYWAPVGGNVVADAVTRYEIGLAHAGALPDETVDGNLLPMYPLSGLGTTFAANLADGTNDPLRTVHPGAHGTAGYVVDPLDASVTSTGTTVMPWPLNQGIPTSDYTRYTWRDTALLALGGANGPGAELQVVAATQGAPAQAGVPYAAGSVPSIGLPLLMEFRCYPDANVTGQNSFDVSLAVASSARPNLRAFSTGGVNTTGSVIFRDPDSQLVATGGFNPNSIPSPGAATLPTDNVFSIGALDLVVRVSRSHSIWIDSTVAAPSWAVAIEPPSPASAGTNVELAFRGASSVTNAALRHDADALGPYGDALVGAQPTFHLGNAAWSSSAAALGGARLIQTRVTFVSNATTSATAELSALGIAWIE